MEFQMRNKTFISSMVGVAATVAVAGSANAALTFDSFTDPATGTRLGTVTSGSFMGGFFTGRTLYADGTSGSGGTAKTLTDSIGSTNLTVDVNGPSGTARYGEAAYSRASNGDLSNLASISVTIAYTNFTGSVNFNFGDATFAQGSQVIDARSAFTGTVNLTFTKADFVGNVDWAQVGNFSMAFTSRNTTAGSAVFTNFNYSQVPAPGALALLGAAGLVGARRRRA
jgi:hypothetical protein